MFSTFVITPKHASCCVSHGHRNAHLTRIGRKACASSGNIVVFCVCASALRQRNSTCLRPRSVGFGAEVQLLRSICLLPSLICCLVLLLSRRSCCVLLPLTSVGWRTPDNCCSPPGLVLLDVCQVRGAVGDAWKGETWETSCADIGAHSRAGATGTGFLPPHSASMTCGTGLPAGERIPIKLTLTLLTALRLPLYAPSQLPGTVFADASGAWGCSALVWELAFPVLLLHRGAGSDIQDASKAAGGETYYVMFIAHSFGVFRPTRVVSRFAGIFQDYNCWR